MIDASPSGPVDISRIFADEDLPPPPIPAGFPLSLRRWGNWLFATAEPRGNPWDLDGFVRAAAADPSPFLLIAHAGYGINSAAIHYFLVWKGLGVFLQVPWGGAYTDNEEAVAILAERFGQIETLIGLASRSLREDERLFVVDGIGGGRWSRAAEADEPQGWTQSSNPIADALRSLGASPARP